MRDFWDNNPILINLTFYLSQLSKTIHCPPTLTPFTLFYGFHYPLIQSFIILIGKSEFLPIRPVLFNLRVIPKFTCWVPIKYHKLLRSHLELFKRIKSHIVRLVDE